jgi:hypothetical protein
MKETNANRFHTLPLAQHSTAQGVTSTTTKWESSRCEKTGQGRPFNADQDFVLFDRTFRDFIVEGAEGYALAFIPCRFTSLENKISRHNIKIGEVSRLIIEMHKHIFLRFFAQRDSDGICSMERCERKWGGGGHVSRCRQPVRTATVEGIAVQREEEEEEGESGGGHVCSHHFISADGNSAEVLNGQVNGSDLMQTKSERVSGVGERRKEVTQTHTHTNLSRIPWEIRQC